MADRIAIVGGGIAGASVAYHLSSRTETPVVVFERGAVAAETTGRSTAVFRMMDDPLLVAMKRYGLGLYNRFLASPTGNPEYELIGRLEAATTEAAAARLQNEELPLGRYVDAEDLSETLICPELDTESVVGALYNPNAGYFRPSELAHEFATRARERGVEFRTNTTVTDVDVEDGRVVSVRTDGGRTAVSHVVATTGPWNLELGRTAGIDVPIRHTLAPILKLKPDTPPTHTLPNIKFTGSGYYVLGQDDGTVLVGHSPGSYSGAGTEYDPDAVSDSVPPDIVSGATDMIAEHLPSLVDAKQIEEWVGIRSLTPDGKPLIGPTEVGGFSIVGFNSEGIQLAPAAGRIVAAQVTDSEPPEYATAVSPSRFGEREA